MGLKNKKRGVFFTTDALIALSIIVTFVFIATPFLKAPSQKNELQYDVITTLSSLKIGEIQDNLAQSLIASGKITNTNNSVLEQIGEFYATNISLAYELADSVLTNLDTRKNIGIWYGSKLISSKNSTPYEDANNVEIARQTISGIQEGQSVSGFSSRAYLTNSEQSKYFYFGGYIGDGNISVNLDYTGNLTSVIMEAVVSNNFSLYINNNFAGSFSKSLDEYTPSTYTFPTSFWNSGTNTVQIKGNNIHISGGFIKMEYQADASYEQPSRYYFTGIDGLINIYDGLYIPGNLTSLSVSLHMNSNYTTFLTIGNTTVYRNSTLGTQTISLSNSFLSSLLNYSSLSKKTVPLRVGIENASYVTTGSNTRAEVVSVTDLSGSMDGTKMASAKDANRLLIDKILNLSGNRVGLAAYDTWARKTDFHSLSNNSASLKNIVNNVWNADGFTCICCGIMKALSCYDSQIFNDNFNGQAAGSNPIGWTLSEGSGNSIDITSESLEGDRAVFVKRGGSSNPSMSHTFPPQENPVSVEFLINNTASTSTGRVKIRIQDQDGLSSNRDYIVVKLYNGWIRNSDNQVVSYSMNKTYKIKISVPPGSSIYNLSVDDNLVGTNLPVAATRTNIAKVEFATETSRSEYIIDNLTIALNTGLCTAGENRTKSMIVMSDGQANQHCGLNNVPDHDSDGSSTNDPQDHAIEAACLAYQKYNITVHAVGFGNGADETTLQRVAQCGNGDYYFGDVEEIANIYSQIAQTILEATFNEQTIQAVGYLKTLLHPDSYIEYDYEKEISPVGLIISKEEKFQNSTSGNFTVPPKTTLLEAHATSYSGARWTFTQVLNNQVIYNLSKYNFPFTELGDPYILWLPKDSVIENNSVSISTAVSSTNTSEGSSYNKIIYKLLKNVTSFTPILAGAEGCTWKIESEDNSNMTISIPDNYGGIEECFYTSSRIEYNENDAIDYASHSLLRELDFDLNGRIDTKFSDQDLVVGTSEVKGIPFSWNTEVQVRIWD